MSDDDFDELLTDEFSELSTDVRVAFVVFENRIRNKYELGGSPETKNILGYVQALEAFVQIYEIEHPKLGTLTTTDLSNIAQSTPVGVTKISSYMIDVLGLVSTYKTMLARERSIGITDIITLSTTSKETIRKLVSQIKQKLDGLEFEISKKDILFQKLNHFLDEQDRDRTKLTAFTAAMVQISTATGESAEKLEPVASLIEKIRKAIGLGVSEQPKLPRWEEQKQLPSPDSIDEEDASG